jgi:2-polyprenyl-3-methyl-5-hydroxy-6-metoxy-1,4-benzoquinol methylase
MNPREREPFESRDVWEGAAEAWDEFVESGGDYYRHEVHGPGLMKACGDVEDLNALDIGCGQGYFARELARAGGVVVGTDISEQMIERALRHEITDPLGVRYEVIDSAKLHQRWIESEFDLVTGCMSVQDMGNTRGVMRSVARVLRPTGRFVFSVPHPATDMPFREWERNSDGGKMALRVDRYFETGGAECAWNMERLKSTWSSPYWRYTLSEWSGLFRDAEFLIRSIHEPRPDAEAVERVPELDDCSRLPYFLVFDLILEPVPPA